MKGHTRRRNGGWVAIIDLPRGEDGKRRQKWLSGFGTKKAAEEAMRRYILRIDDGTYVEDSKQRFADYLNDDWLPAIRTTVRASTEVSYARVIRQHVIPALGDVPLQKITAPMLNEFYAAMIAKGLSSRMARYAHTLVRKALADAVVWNRVARNVAAAAKPPRLTSPEIECWSRDDLRAFLDAAREDRLFPALLLAATTGMRRGELLGLKWNAIDFERSRIAVIRTLVLVGEEAVESEPKTAAGKRSIPIDPRTLATLQEWRKRQIEDRLKAGPRWKDSGYVFTEPEDGRPIHPRSFTKHFARLVRRVGVRPISVHGLRHTFITLALGAGVPVKVVSEIVGHSDPGFTLRKYAHAIPALQEDATSRVAGLILGGQA